MFVIPTRAQPALSQTASGKTIWDGVFSEEQVARGRTAYNISCASCHRSDLSGFESALRGQRFMDHWREDSLESLYSNIKKSMPRNEPGSLESATYVDIIAYILQQNGFPTGASELKADLLKSIQLTGKEGAEPLPAGALVQAYGCIKEEPSNTWLLTYATNAVRTRNPDKSSDSDLKTAEAKLPGKASYRLVDAPFYHPERYRGQMAEAKGFLVSDPSEGISLTTLAPLSISCP
jgi:mono/diheme cytochrome c family protein